jgi:adenosine deaminase
MSLASYVQAMPKVELHVHLEGTVRPETLLALARRHGVALPADTVEGVRGWYTFADYAGFREAYYAVADCLRTPDDIERVAREFLADQAAQSVLHSEATYSPYIHWRQHRIPFSDQLAAVNRARTWGAQELGISMTLTIDMPRSSIGEDSLLVAGWAISGLGNGVTAFGLGGREAGYPPERFAEAFERARAAGLHSAPHAGEGAGAASIWGALRALGAERIGHGIRCLEDPALVDELRARQIPLEVCPSANVALGIVPFWPAHPLPQLLASGLFVTLNSDCPPMFGTTISEEYLRTARTFGVGVGGLDALALNGLRAAFLPAAERDRLATRMRSDFASLRARHLGMGIPADPQ